ncbi:MAG: pyridoxal-phosphate dependent enzyme, partial [Candidatus Latescibacterota bacterium]
LAGTPPDLVLCPVGAGSILLGLYRGFVELRQAGLLPRLPRLVAVQSEAVAPVCRALAEGAQDVAPAVLAGLTLAEGIALPGPVRGRGVLEALRATGGTAVAVSEAEIAAAVRTLGRAGLCVEPTAAVVLPGLLRLRRQGLCRPGETAVLVLSGSGLKAPAALGEILG